MEPRPLPIETVRDLLGIVRALYVLHRGKGNHGHARALQAAGTQLRRALELAVRANHVNDASAQGEAWRLSNLAIVAIARVQGNFADDLSAVVRLASARVKHAQRETIDRQARRHARIKRG